MKVSAENSMVCAMATPMSWVPLMSTGNVHRRSPRLVHNICRNFTLSYQPAFGSTAALPAANMLIIELRSGSETSLCQDSAIVLAISKMEL